MDMQRRLGAELFGTFWLTFAGCGSAVLAAGFPQLGIGFLGVSFAFGLTVLTMAYAVGHISGGHFNCAVTIGLWAGGRFKASDVLPYVIAQVIGAILAAAISTRSPPASPIGCLAVLHPMAMANSAPANTICCPASWSRSSLRSSFCMSSLAPPRRARPWDFAGIPIGLCLTLIHLFLIPVTNASVNPARSTGPALFAGGAYLAQLWLFWVAPILGAAIAGLVSRWQHEPPGAA